MLAVCGRHLCDRHLCDWQQQQRDDDKLNFEIPASFFFNL